MSVEKDKGTWRRRSGGLHRRLLILLTDTHLHLRQNICNMRFSERVAGAACPRVSVRYLFYCTFHRGRRVLWTFASLWLLLCRPGTKWRCRGFICLRGPRVSQRQCVSTTPSAQREEVKDGPKEKKRVCKKSCVSSCPRSGVALLGLDNSELPLKVDWALRSRHSQTLDSKLENHKMTGNKSVGFSCSGCKNNTTQ